MVLWYSVSVGLVWVVLSCDNHIEFEVVFVYHVEDHVVFEYHVEGDVVFVYHVEGDVVFIYHVEGDVVSVEVVVYTCSFLF